jgi:hypothetical protein
MDLNKQNTFETAANCLERLAGLEEKHLLEDSGYQELRGLVISEMKRSVKSTRRSRKT